MKFLSITLSLAFFFVCSQSRGDVVYIDFGDRFNIAPLGTDFYNTTPGGINGQQLSAAGFPFTVSNLKDIDGVTSTGIGMSLGFYNNGPGQTAFFNQGEHSGLPGFETFAKDGYFVDNRNSNSPHGVGNEFGFILTYSGLDPNATYDLSVWVNANVNNFFDSTTWAVTTGTGDSDVESYGDSSSDVLDWTNVASDASGNIVLTNEAIANGNFASTFIAFASISESVPEPSSATFLTLAMLRLLLARRRRPEQPREF